MKGSRSIIRTMTIRHALLALLLAASAVPGLAQAPTQETATTNRSTDLKDKPSFFDGKALATLPENTQVKVLARNSGWTQVETAANQKGWVRVFHLRFAATVEQSTSSNSSLGGLSSMLGFGRPKQENAKIATIGIRGLSEEELKNANPDAGQLAKLINYRVDKATAERFAKENPALKPQQVAYVDEAPAPAPQKGRR